MKAQDIQIPLEFEFEEDIEAELVDFVRLARQGLVEEARVQFNETLSPHINVFPVLAEYAEFLMSVNCFTEILRILPRKSETYSPDEWWLIKLLGALAQSHAEHDTVEAAVAYARRWRIHVAQNWSEDPSEVEVICELRPLLVFVLKRFQVQCLEIYLNIMVLATKSSVQITHDDCLPPATTYSFRYLRWGGFRDVADRLMWDRKYWEAQKIMRLLMKVATPERARSYAEVMLSSLKDGWDRGNDRNAVLAWLIISSDLMNVMLENTEWLRSHNVDGYQDVGVSLINQAGLQHVQGRHLSKWEDCLRESRRRQQRENTPVLRDFYLLELHEPAQRQPDRQKAVDKKLADKRKLDDQGLRERLGSRWTSS
ncbi:hypothetical protein LTS15_009159 [Exophiala xenobiotica]|nr:hypothetical protein LTS15_009159 [Exophiala xenobiotica]